MKVYVVEIGCYEAQHVGGIYSSPEKAMEAHPIPDHPRTGVGEWVRDDYSDGTPRWHNGLDWDEFATILAWDLDDQSDEDVPVPGDERGDA